MKFKLSVDCANAAFADDLFLELSAVLERVADAVERHNLDGSCRDSNGNTVGEFFVTDAEDDE